MNVNKIEPIENIEENKKIMREKSGSKSKKHLNFNIGIMTKEQIREEAGMKIFAEKKDKNELINNNVALESNQKEEIDMNEDIDVNLSNLEVNSVNFINDFKNFLDKVNISIVNNFPVSLSEKNKKYFNQNTFWFLLLNYLFYQNQNITIYSILSLIEQYFIWCQDITKENFLQIKALIKEYISKNLTNEKINQILFMNKLKSIDDIFTRYDLYFNENKRNHLNYKEIKVDDLNFMHNANAKCECDLCKSDEACLKKVADINKEKIKIIKGQNLDFIGNKDINKPEVNMDIDNGEEIYFKGISNKKKKVFTESKTRLSENTNFVYTSINSVNNNIINKEDSDEKNKTYKNISKRKDKIEKVLEEKKSSEKKENKEENEEKEEIEIVTKNKKKGRPKKDKSLNKRKKKDKSKDKKNEEENEEKEKEKEEEKAEKEIEKKKEKDEPTEEGNKNGDPNESKEAAPVPVPNPESFNQNMICNKNNPQEKIKQDNKNQMNELSTKDKTYESIQYDKNGKPIQKKSFFNFNSELSKISEGIFEKFCLEISYKDYKINYENITYGKNNIKLPVEKFEQFISNISYLKMEELKPDDKIMLNNLIKLLAFFEELKFRIKIEYQGEEPLNFEINLANKDNNNEHNNDIFNIEALYRCNDTKNGNITTYKDKNILINGTNSLEQGFNYMILYINSKIKQKDK